MIATLDLYKILANLLLPIVRFLFFAGQWNFLVTGSDRFAFELRKDLPRSVKIELSKFLGQFQRLDHHSLQFVVVSDLGKERSSIRKHLKAVKKASLPPCNQSAESPFALGDHRSLKRRMSFQDPKTWPGQDACRSIPQD